MIDSPLFTEFIASSDALRVYEKGGLIFVSKKDGLMPLLDYIDESSSSQKPVIVFDRVVGNAAALLLKKLHCDETYSPLGSELAVKTLSSFGIKYHFGEIVPCIQNPDRGDMCPMEKLSINKSPEEFYRALKGRLAGTKVRR